jgi:tetratricopeptide (TPR) repeat protein
MSGGVVRGEGTQSPRAAARGLTTHDPKITDFGLAKQLEAETGPTGSRTILGTPSYMAPEQAQGESKVHPIGPATDVYSLGAILYELLTGRPPFRAETPLETALQVVSQEPVPPSVLQPKVPRDLETICLKCLQKEVPRRYAGALDLAEDLRRFLDGRPVRARPAGPWTRTLKWVKRHPAPAALLLVIGMALAAGGFGIVWHNVRLQAAVRRAEANGDLAWRAADDMYTQIAQKWLARQARLDEVQRRFLLKALHFYQEFAEQNSTNPVVGRQTGTAYLRVGAIEQKLGAFAEAEKAYTAAAEIFDGLAADQPEDARQLAAAHRGLGRLFQITSRRNQAEAAYRRAETLLAGLAAAHPDVPAYRQDLATARDALCFLYRTSMRLGGARKIGADALAIRQRLVREYPGEVAYRRDLADSYYSLGAVSKMSSRMDRAEEAFRSALTLRERLAWEYPDVPEYRQDQAHADYLLGNFYQDTSRPDRAETCYREALTACEGLVRDHPTVPEYQEALASNYRRLGLLLFETNRPAEAERIYRKARGLYQALVRRYPEVMEFAIGLGNCWAGLGELALQGGQLDAAVHRYDEAIRHLEGVRKRERRRTGVPLALFDAYLNRGLARGKQGRRAASQRDYARAARFGRAGHRDVELCRVHTLARLGDYETAVREAEALVQTGRLTAEEHFALACGFALSCGAAREDKKRPAAEREQLAQRLAARAVAHLVQARAAGFFKTRANRERLRLDTNIDPVRAREDYQDLVRQLEPKHSPAR